jgi:hypothetical protein
MQSDISSSVSFFTIESVGMFIYFDDLSDDARTSVLSKSMPCLVLMWYSFAVGLCLVVSCL